LFAINLQAQVSLIFAHLVIFAAKRKELLVFLCGNLVPIMLQLQAPVVRQFELSQATVCGSSLINHNFLRGRAGHGKHVTYSPVVVVNNIISAQENSVILRRTPGTKILLVIDAVL